MYSKHKEKRRKGKTNTEPDRNINKIMDSVHKYT